MFCVFRLPNQEPVRLSFIKTGEGWALDHDDLGVRVGSTHNVGSLLADKVMGLKVDETVRVSFSVGAESQVLEIARDGARLEDSVITDEDGVVYPFLESPFETLLSTAQAEAIQAWLDKADRQRPRA